MINKLEKRILEISYNRKLSHLSSNLSSVGIIDEIYSIKKENEPFILSNGHAGLALYVVLEKYYGINAEALHEKHGVHPNRDLENKIFYSTGSLGCGLPAACGMALADKTRNVYCLISDGEMFEGSIYETFNIINKYKINNLKIYANVNGYSALAEFDKYEIIQKLKNLHQNIEIRLTDYIYQKFSFVKGLSGHYNLLLQEDYNTYVSTPHS
jgi:transketolase